MVSDAGAVDHQHRKVQRAPILASDQMQAPQTISIERCNVLFQSLTTEGSQMQALHTTSIKNCSKFQSYTQNQSPINKNVPL